MGDMMEDVLKKISASKDIRGAVEYYKVCLRVGVVNDDGLDGVFGFYFTKSTILYIYNYTLIRDIASIFFNRLILANGATSNSAAPSFDDEL